MAIWVSRRYSIHWQSCKQNGISGAAAQWHFTNLQLGELQAHIDNLYKDTFAGVEVELSPQASTSRTPATEASPKQSFDDLSESRFNLLGRQRPQVLKVSHLYHLWHSVSATAMLLSEIAKELQQFMIDRLSCCRPCYHRRRSRTVRDGRNFSMACRP